MHIAYVNNQVQLGGAETVVAQLRAAAERAGHRTSLHVANGKVYPAGISPLYPRVLSYLSHTRLHTMMEWLFPRAEWTDRCFRRLAESDADVVHVHNFHGDYATIPSLAHLAQAKPTLWTFHAFWGMTGGCDHPRLCRRYEEACGSCPQVGSWPVGPIDRTSAQLDLKLQHLAQAPLEIIAPSRYVADKVSASRVGKNWRVHSIPNGVDGRQFNPARKQDPEFRRSLGLKTDLAKTCVLVVCRDFKAPLKGFPMVLRALEAVARASLQLVLVGQNSDWAAAQLRSAWNVVTVAYIQSRSQLAAWYDAADIFLFASEAENFPCVILEAMAAGCCVVATPTGGVPEQIKDGETGFLAESVSGPSLGKVLWTALTDPERSQRCAAQARQQIEGEFSEANMVNRHLRLYSEVGRASCGVNVER